MSDKVKRIGTLIYKYRLDDLLEEERRELMAWRNESEGNEQTFQSLTNAPIREEELAIYKRGDLDNVEGWQKILSHGLPKANRSPVIRMTKYYATAAAVVVLLVTGAYFIKNRNAAKISSSSTAIAQKNDLPPGSNVASLTLADGTQVPLNTAQNGHVAIQGSTNIVKLADGQLSYQSTASPSSEAFFNTVRIPRGGQYQLTLSDGTKVWMNSASTLRFPTAFAGRERIVELTGQAYFEVAKNAAQPFFVQLPDNQKIRVLGTHFDVMAYPDEAESKVTLLEGLVKVSRNTHIATLHPGEQAQMTNGEAGEIDIIKDADVDEAVAWKNGYFMFKKASIETIMRQVSRWYDVDIEYKGEPITTKFYSEIARNSKVSTVFESLAATGKVHFDIQGKKIIVSR